MDVALPSAFFLFTSQFASQQSPIIVRITEPSGDPTGIAHVIVQALGLTGALTVLAVLFGIMLAAAMVWFRSRAR